MHPKINEPDCKKAKKIHKISEKIQRRINELERRPIGKEEKIVNETQVDQEASLKEEVENLKKEIILLENQKVIAEDPFNIINSEMIKSLQTIREISSGGSWKVLEVAKEETFALKVMYTDEQSIKNIRDFIGEYEKLVKLHHPNIVRTYGVFLNDESNTPSILLEFCPADVESAIKTPSISNVLIVIWIYQIVEGMRYVHECQIVHGNIKPSNILIGKDGKVRISDFGIAKLMTTTEEQSTSLSEGTQKFMAPEILKEEEYDEKVDVYSFGVLVFFMLSRGEMPRIKVVEMGNGRRADFPNSFAQLAKDLINMCWNNDAKDRLSFDEILSLLEKNNFKLFEFNDQEILEIEQFVKQHKEEIASY